MVKKICVKKVSEKKLLIVCEENQDCHHGKEVDILRKEMR